MALKLDANMSGVAHHIVDGPFHFPYAIDAHHAVAQHPTEWKLTPWSAEDAAAARRDAGIPDDELSPEEQAAIDEHAQAVAEAGERLAKVRADLEEKRQAEEQVKRDEALVASAPPRPDPNRPKRPFGRPGEPTTAELELINKREAKKADDDRLREEKSAADKQANPNAIITG